MMTLVRAVAAALAIGAAVFASPTLAQFPPDVGPNVPTNPGTGSSGITKDVTTCTSCNANGLLYSDGSVVKSLATANSGVLVTSAGGVPSISSTLPAGLITGGGTACSAGNLGLAIGANVQGFYSTGTNIAVCANGTKLDYGITNGSGWTFGAQAAFGVMVLSGGTGLNTGTLNITAGGALIHTGITTDATHTDATVCEDTTSHQYYFGSGTAGICLGTSSIRFKDAIAPLSSGLSDLMRLDTITYHYKPGYGDPSRKLYGFTAEQMYGVIPDLVGLDPEGRPNSVDWAGLVPVLVNSIKELKGQIEQLRAARG